MAATPEEYADLKDELEGEPYHYNLVVRKKSSHRYDEARRNEARRKRDAD